MKDIYRNAKSTYCLFYEICRSVGGKRHWAKRIAFCDKKLTQKKGSGILELLRSIKVWVIVINVAVLLSIILATSSCVSTIRGTGQMISGVGQGTGTIVKGVGDYLQEEMEGK
jgi:hypothetical protein